MRVYIYARSARHVAPVSVARTRGAKITKAARVVQCPMRCDTHYTLPDAASETETE